MFDPCTLAFEIKSPFKNKSGRRNTLITIWHKDPCTDGTDSSCGWFMRSRHIDQKLLENVRKEFAFNFKHNYWFNEAGYPKFSTVGIALEMYSTAAWRVFMHLNNGKPDRKRHRKFMRKYLYDILHFAENPTDSLHPAIWMNFGVEKQDERITHFTSIITSDIMRKLRPWWKHPKWHIHHWQLQFVFLRIFRKREEPASNVDTVLRDTV